MRRAPTPPRTAGPLAAARCQETAWPGGPRLRRTAPAVLAGMGPAQPYSADMPKCAVAPCWNRLAFDMQEQLAAEKSQKTTSSEEQVAALRWSIEDGTVDQIFVNPAWRRKGVGSSTIYTADAFHQFNGWPGRLKSDGRRTEMGETFIATLRFPQRMEPLRELSPPMDPPR